jgi:hypothetical protein
MIIILDVVASFWVYVRIVREIVMICFFGARLIAGIAGIV